MSKAIMIGGSVLLLCIGWWFTTYAVLTFWMGYGTSRLLIAGAKGGAF